MNTQTQEALRMAIAYIEGDKAWLHLKDEVLNACKEALESYPLVTNEQETNADVSHKQHSQEQESVACPYPCGWNNLYKITTEKGAYLVTHFDIDNPMPYSYWQEISSIVDTARTLVKWGMNIKTHPAQPYKNGEWSEATMKRWDAIRKMIADGDRSSYPRDWFESLAPDLQPLSDDEIGVIHDSISEKLMNDEFHQSWFDWEFARAIEKAIMEKNK